MKKLNLLIILLVVGLVVWFYQARQPEVFSLTFFDVGQGDAALVQIPGGQNILIDGGPDRSVLSKLGQTLPWGNRQIDLVILSHPHSDHVTGLAAVLENYQVRQVLITGVSHTAPAYLQFLQYIRDKKIPALIGESGQIIKLAGGVEVQVLYPTSSYAAKVVADINTTSLVVKIKYGETGVLFTGDMPIEVENELLRRQLDLSAQILKVSHQGSLTSSGPDFLQAVNPTYAVISVGARNLYGHPSAEVLNRLQNRGIIYWRTDQAGDIKFVSDGKIWEALNHRP